MKREDPNVVPPSSLKKKQKTEDRDEMNLCNMISVKLALRNMRKSNKGDEKNIVSSPLSINLLLNMLANGFKQGSVGQIELLNALGFSTIDEINTAAARLMKLMTGGGESSYEDSAEHKELMDELAKKRGGVISPRIKKLMDKHNDNYGKPGLVIASGVWADRASPFKPQFVETAAKIYQSCTETLDFSEEEKVVERVNSWAEEKTRGLIKDLVSLESLSNGGEKTKLILANSIYFKAVWANEFEESMTKEEKFHLADGTSVKVPFMISERRHLYRSLDGFKLLCLPYRSLDDFKFSRSPKGSKFSMYLFLPELKNGLKKLLKRFEQDPSLIHTECGSSHNCITRIPKFNIQFDFKPSDVMKKMGLDLSKMGLLTSMIDIPKKAEGGVVKVIQKSCIEVNERGTKAASGSCGYFHWHSSLGPPPPPPPPVMFVADHPFFFMIKDDVSGAVLFSGIVRNPLLS